MTNTKNNFKYNTALLSLVLLLLSVFTTLMAQEAPQEEHKSRFVKKDRTPVRHIEINVKGKKRVLPVYEPLNSSKPATLQSFEPLGPKKKNPGRFDSYDLLSAKKLDASDSTFVNTDYLTNSTPYVNARNFENYGVFDVESPLQMPFYFYNTRSFTNKGNIFISGNIDFQTYNTKENLFGDFDYDPVMATNFVNERTGVVENKADIGALNFINIHALEIINRGLISGAGSITISLKGENVDLTGGALEMKAGASFDYYEKGGGDAPYFGWGGYNDQRVYTSIGDPTAGYHIPSWGVSDVYWCEYRGISSPVPLIGTYQVGDLLGVLTPLHSWNELRATYAIVDGPELEPRPNGWYITWLGGWEFNGRWEAVFDSYVDESVYYFNDAIHNVTQMALVRNRYPDLFEVDAKLLPFSVDRDGNFEPEIFHDGKVVEIKSINGLTKSIIKSAKLGRNLTRLSRFITLYM